VWSETPFSDSYLIGGNSDSADFTEDKTCASNGKGCAYLANWNKVSQEFTQKWIFTKASDVVDIKFESFAETQTTYTFAVIFSEEDVVDDEPVYRHVVTFNEWKGKLANLATIAYTMTTPYDPEVIDDFQRLTVMQDGRFHMVSNQPSKLQTTDYFFILDGEEVTSVYSDVLNTENEAKVHLGIPTRKYAQGFGYDADHIIQLATITVPRGDKELGGQVTLGEHQTYQVVISRSMTEAGTPFTY